MYRELFKRTKIGKCSLKNRIIMAPIGNINMADPIGRPLEKMIAYFTERAKGGTGLIISGLVPVSFGIDPTVSEESNTTYFPRIDGSSRTRLVGWRDLAAAVHSFDSKFFIQLTAGMGRVGSPECALKMKIPKGASLGKNFYLPLVPHLPFTDRALKKIVKSFGQSAINAKVSGVDGIQLHGHEGYLLDQLTSMPWNRRKLGRYRNRFRFAIDVVREIKEICGEDFPIIYRVDLTQGLRQSYGEKIFKKEFRGMERSIEEGLEFCKQLYHAGVDAFDVDKGCYDNWFFSHPPAYFDDMPYVNEVAGTLKKFFEKEKIDAPVIAVGKMGKPEIAEKVLKEGIADMVMLGRPLLADPYWPEKVRKGREKEIIHCIGDQEACIHSFIMGGHPCCSVNPYTGFEDTKKSVKTETPKTVAIVGAGPGGCEAALTACERGHNVTLFEKTGNTGGQFRMAANMKIKHDVKRYLDNLEHRLSLLHDKGLDLRKNEEPTTEQLKDYDVIICATGLLPVIPKIEGADAIPHTDARTLLQNNLKLPEEAKDITIIGGGVVSCELACELAALKDCNITIVEQDTDLMKGVVHANRAMLLWLMMGMGSTDNTEKSFVKNKVEAYVSSKAVRVLQNRVIVSANKKRNDPFIPWRPLIPENVHNPFAKKQNPDNTEEIDIKTDYIIYSTGGMPDNTFYRELVAKMPEKDIYCIGDARKAASGWEAITAANDIAREI